MATKKSGGIPTCIYPWYTRILAKFTGPRKVVPKNNKKKATG